MAENQSRVMLWCVPRSVSTAFEVCMSNLDEVQIICEPLITAFLLGHDNRHQSDFIVNANKQTAVPRANEKKSEIICAEQWESESFSLKYAKENVLEAEYPGKKVVFVKDMSYAVTDCLDMIPKGYRHAFLIRNPEKMFPSWKKVIAGITRDDKTVLEAGDNKVIPKGCAFGESFQLYEHLTKSGIESKPFIIDADDLLENPESILRQFCSFAGIEYTDKLLSWNRGRGVTKDWKVSKEIWKWNEVADFHKNALESKEFKKPSAAPSRSEMSEDVIHCIEASLPFYNKLYALRTLP